MLGNHFMESPCFQAGTHNGTLPPTLGLMGRTPATSLGDTACLGRHCKHGKHGLEFLGDQGSPGKARQRNGFCHPTSVRRRWNRVDLVERCIQAGLRCNVE